MRACSCPTLCDRMDCSPPGKNIEVGCHFLLQGIFLTQGRIKPASLELLHWQADCLPLCHLGSPSYRLLLLPPRRFSRFQLNYGVRPTRLLCPWDSQARTLEWVAISLSNACMLSRFSRVRLCGTLWTAAHQAPLSTGFSMQECWSGLPFHSLSYN